MTRTWLPLLMASVAGCTVQVESPRPLPPKTEQAPGTDPKTDPKVAAEEDSKEEVEPDPDPVTDPVVDEIPVEDARLVMTVVLPQLVGRVATPGEHARLDSEGASALGPILEEALSEPAFAQSARTLISRKLFVSGARSGVDFDLPGNLAAHIARHDLPWSKILTASSCYDAEDKEIACDTGAPYTAGVLTTRGYLMSRAGRFNLTRASTLMRAFACAGYPQREDLQPLLPKERLIELFRAESAEEAAAIDERAAGGFGNGNGCYSCHGQFAAHTQLFVRFDDQGTWREDATGVQDPTGELGRSFDGLMTSHMFDPEAKKSEESEMFGQPVANLAEAMEIFVQNPVFGRCAVRNVLEHTLLVDAAVDVDTRFLDRAAAAAKARRADPTLQDFVVATLTDPLVVESVARSLRGAP